MGEPDWDGLREAVADALEAPAEERAAALARACGGDPALLGVARGLVEMESRRREFLQPPMPGAAGVALAESAAEGGIDVRFGPYRATAVIAVGGMGTVYRAVRADDAFERAVAVKVVNPGLVSPEAMRRFESERRVLARLTHPGIAALLDGGCTDGGVPYLVMEFVDGEPIDRWCRQRAADVRTRVGLMRAVCAAVQHAHAALVVHRDLKPSNILVTFDGTSKLLDFGVSRLLEGPHPASDRPAPTLAALTPRYASPEQLRAEPITTAADVFSLGVVLYELVAGEPPWPERAIDRGEPRPPSSVGGVRDRDLDAIVLTAMRPFAEERYPSAQSLGEDLDRWLASLPIRARAPSVADRARKFGRRHRVGVALAGLAVLAIAAATVVAAWLAIDLARERARAVAAYHSAERINRFLADTLEAADAGIAGGKPISVASLLDNAAARLAAVGDDPAAEGALRLTLGRAYGNLGRYVEAGPHLTSAPERLRAAHGPSDPRVAEALQALAGHRLASGDSGGAREAADEALRILRQARGLRHPETAEAAVVLARIALASGDAGAADHLVTDALDVLRSDPGADPRPLARALACSAECAAALGQADRARALREEAVEVLRDQLGPGSREEATALARLAETLTELGDLDAAENAARRALDITVGRHGREHPTVTYQMLTLAGVLERRGELDDAERLLADTGALAAQCLPPDHYIPMFLRYRHGQVLARLGRAAEAREELAAAYQAAVTLIGPDHPNTRRIAGELAAALDAEGDKSGAALWRTRSQP
jgi:eukaryotic-like serine/threonine-protein kinase